jgi:hypothetical protein
VPLMVGAVLRSAVSSAEVVAVRVGDPSVVVELGGQPMAADPGAGAGGPGPQGGQLALGKRYVHETAGLELLCVRPGPGQLTVDGTPLGLKAQTRPAPR